jgi:hypothetical protein
MVASSALLIIVIVAATIAGRMGVDAFKVPWLTVSACILVATCFVVQLGAPQLLSFVERNGSAILGGEIYRLFTALWFQDGGAAGAAFNIAMLAVLGTLAEQLFARPMWLTIYLIGGLLTEIVALAWQPVGAGNSVAYMSLAGALLGGTLFRRASRSSLIPAGLGLGAGLILCLTKDIHGAACLIGCALVLLARVGSDKRLRTSI